MTAWSMLWVSGCLGQNSLSIILLREKKEKCEDFHLSSNPQIPALQVPHEQGEQEYSSIAWKATSPDLPMHGLTSLKIHRE